MCLESLRPMNLKKWYDYTYKKIMGEFSNHNINEIIFKYPKHETYIKRGAKGLIFGEISNEIEIGINDNLDEITFNSRLGDLFLSIQ